MTEQLPILRIIFALWLAFIPLAANAADFEKGREAYDSGDYATALEELSPLAQEGHADAQAILGHMFNSGKGVEQDYAKAVIWYRKAAEQGHANAQNSLGYSYGKGEGVRQSYTEAIKWLHKAAEQGHVLAQRNLGVTYRFGREGVPQDFLHAAIWLHKAAEQGDARAQSLLGDLYAHGRGVNQDYAYALKWFRRAALQGDPNAQFNLGIAYENGDGGVEQNNILAYAWYIVASKNHDHRFITENMNNLIRRLSQRDIERAKVLADICFNSNYRNCPEAAVGG